MHEEKPACPACKSTNVVVIVYYLPPSPADIEGVAHNLLRDRYPPYYWTEAVQQRLGEERISNLAKARSLFEEKTAELRQREERGEIALRKLSRRDEIQLEIVVARTSEVDAIENVVQQVCQAVWLDGASDAYRSVVSLIGDDWHCNSCGNDWRRKVSARTWVLPRRESRARHDPQRLYH